MARRSFGGWPVAVRAHCERAGRPYAAIEKTVLNTLMTRAEANEHWKSPSQALEMPERHPAAGADQIFNMPFVDDAKTLEFIGAEIIPSASKL